MTSATLESLDVHAVDRARWPDLERLFESPGGPKHCWCMPWRPMPKGASRNDREAKKAVLRESVSQGVPVGLLAYLHGDPIGWCSVAPRTTYRNLGGPDDPPGVSVWSIACFFLLRRYRGLGVGERLLTAAVDYAKRNGANVVEAYPVNPDSPSYRFMGFVSTFQKAGFHEVGTAGSRRHVMRLVL